MTRWLFLLVPALVLVLVIGLRLQLPSQLERLQLQVFDVLQRLKPREYVQVPVRIVDIDDASLEAVGQWPWPRTRIAELIKKLNGAGAMVIALDLVFAEPDRTSPAQILPLWSDSELIRALALALPDHDRELAKQVAAAPVVTAVALNQESIKPRSQIKLRFAAVDRKTTTELPQFSSAVVNLPPIERAASGSGSVNVIPDKDNIVRRLHMAFRLDGALYPGFAAETVRVAQQIETYSLHIVDNVLQGTRIGAFTIPTDAAGRAWLYYTRPQPQRYISAKDILNTQFERDTVSGHIVIVGTSAVGLADFQATPLNPVTPGAEVHATLIEQILLGKFLQRPDWAKGIEILYLVALGLVLILLLRRLHPVSCAIVGGFAAVLAFGSSWYAFVTHGILLDPLVPSLEVLLIYLAGSLVNFVQSETQRRHVRDAFNHYLAPDVVEQLLKEPDRLALGGETREMTFLFTDVQGFTAFTERTEPTVVVKLLNDYLENTCDIILQHGGMIDKIVGDALHVMFNAPSRQADHAERAVRCALALDTFCQQFAAEQEQQGYQFGTTRIGINTGHVVVGNFGGAARFDYSAHGDAINTAARLENANKTLGTRICVSETTRSQCDGIVFRPIGRLLLRGKQTPVEVYEPLAPQAVNSERDAAYLEIYRALDDPKQVLEALSELARRFPDDQLIDLHRRRLTAGESGRVIEMRS
ncbi:MAG: adenylate/guanylate cyclase domain-containing protein [Gammaproteobacteria bacterium]|nr:adenylate/guanylate cyclase domain-containing protein [Gammaproteobacteria bacterium]